MRPLLLTTLASLLGCAGGQAGRPRGEVVPDPVDTGSRDTGTAGGVGRLYDCAFERTETVAPLADVLDAAAIRTSFEGMHPQPAAWTDGDLTVWSVRFDPDSLPTEVETVRFTYLQAARSPPIASAASCPDRVYVRLPVQATAFETAEGAVTLPSTAFLGRCNLDESNLEILEPEFDHTNHCANLVTFLGAADVSPDRANGEAGPFETIVDVGASKPGRWSGTIRSTADPGGALLESDGP